MTKESSFAAKVAGELEKERLAASQSALTGTVLYALVCFIIIAYTTFLFTQSKNVLSEKTLAQAAAGYIAVDFLPTARPRIDAFLVNRSPVLAASLIDTLLGRLPEMRVAISEAMLTVFESKLGEAHDIAIDNFDLLVEQHREEIGAALEHLGTDEGRTEFRKTLLSLMENQYRAEASIYAMQMQGQLSVMHDHLSRILTSDPAALTSEEQEQRHILYLALAVSREMITLQYSRSSIDRFLSAFENAVAGGRELDAGNP